ncbi:hypothetical protein COY52_05825, partial [Candidatus Desantisbacteria bacterium CG_4_10_14_0_8_um_filter_48_22]
MFKKHKIFFFLILFITICRIQSSVCLAQVITEPFDFTVTAYPEIAYNASLSTVTVIVAKQSGGFVEGWPVNLSIEGDAVFIPSSSKSITVNTDKNGVIKAMLSPQKVGSCKVKAEIFGSTSGIKYINISFLYMPGNPTGIPCRGTQRTIEGVNTLNGNLCFTVRDFQISGRGPDIEFFRTYNSQSDYIGILGKGWVCNYDIRILNPSAGDTIYFMDEYGGIKGFSKKGSIYEPPPGVYLNLTQSQSYWIVTDKFGTKYYFDNGNYGYNYPYSLHLGRLIKIVDRNNNELVLTWSLVYVTIINGIQKWYIKLDSIKNMSSNQQINFYYNCFEMYNFDPVYGRNDPYYIGVVFSIYGFFDGRRYEYNYEYGGPPASADAAPYLVNSYVSQGVAKYYGSYYRYESYISPFGYYRNICKLIYADDPRRSPGSSRLSYKYDDFGRLAEIQKADGLNTPVLRKFEYRFFEKDGKMLPETHITENFDNVKSHLTIDRYNEKGFHSEIELPNFEKITAVWDEEKLNKTQINNRGIITEYFYDAKGNVIKEIIHGRGEYNKTEVAERSYNQTFGGIEWLRNARGYNTYWTYESSNGNLLQVSEQIGGSNKVTTYGYNSSGERISTTEVGINE